MENIDKKKFFVLVGVPASGKSTWIKNTFQEFEPYVINVDDIVHDVARRLNLQYDSIKSSDDPATEMANQLIGKEVKNKISQAVSSGKDIVVDMLNLTPKKRKFAMSAIRGRENEYHKIAIVFEFEGAEKEIIKNAEKRAQLYKSQGSSKTISANDIKNMMSSFKRPTKEEGFDEIISVDNREKIKSLVSESKIRYIIKSIILEVLNNKRK
jgi:predicted kinase